jgi:hypothetical protein
MPSKPSLQAWLKMVSPSPSICSFHRRPGPTLTSRDRSVALRTSRGSRRKSSPPLPPEELTVADDVPKMFTRREMNPIAERSQRWREERSRHPAQSEPRNFRTAPRKAEASERRDTRVQAAPASPDRWEPRAPNCSDGVGHDCWDAPNGLHTRRSAWRLCPRQSGFAIGIACSTAAMGDSRWQRLLIDDLKLFEPTQE